MTGDVRCSAGLDRCDKKAANADAYETGRDLRRLTLRRILRRMATNVLELKKPLVNQKSASKRKPKNSYRPIKSRTIATPKCHRISFIVFSEKCSGGFAPAV